MNTTINREIHFFRVDAGRDASGKPLSFSPLRTLEHVDKLKWDSSGSKGKYWKDADKITACWIDGLSAPFKIRIGNIRRADFPQIEQQGEVTPLEMPESSGLVEQTHIVFFDNNIAGCDFNFYGPRITRLSYYLAEKAVGISPTELNFTPILRQDVYRQLQRFKFLKLFNLKIRSTYADVIKSIDDSLGDSFKAAIKAGEADEIELILRCTKRSKGWLSEGLLENAKKIIQQRDLRYETSKFVVSGYVEDERKVQVLDLLSDLMIMKKAIRKAERRSKALNPTAAYNAIISAYEELRDEIESSASVSI